jgi:PII-like signaling protein
MLQTGSAKKLVIYVNEKTQLEGRPVHQTILQWLHDHGVAGATVTRAVAGYGAHGSYHVSKPFRLIADVPMRIEVVESAERIHRILPFIFDMVPSGLVEVQDTEVVKHTQKASAEPTVAGEHVKLEGRAKMLRIYIDEGDTWEGAPLYEAILKTLRMMDVAGATVYRGVLGYGAQQRLHKSAFLGLSHNLPIMITVVDTAEKVLRAISVLDEMVGAGLIVLSDVEVIKYTHAKS